jgi:hypothetical protein
MDIRAFQAKWRDASLKERTAAQEHFTDLCRFTPEQLDRSEFL